MKKRSNRSVWILGIVACLAVAGAIAFLAAGAWRLRQRDREMDEQFALEQEKTQETINRLKEQEAALDTEIEGIRVEDSKIRPETGDYLVSILDCEPGALLDEAYLYPDNPGIYFTAQQIAEDGEIRERAGEKIDPKVTGIPLEELRYLKMPYYDTEGNVCVGEMIVRASVSQEVLNACRKLFEEKTQLFGMALEDHIWIEEENCESIMKKIN